jgi:hypothetical protein
MRIPWVCARSCAGGGNKLGTDGDRPTRTDGDPRPMPARGTTITQRLGEEVRQLLGRVLDQTHLAVLDGLVREVLAGVDVLGALPSSDHVVFPVDADGVVLIHQSVWVLGEAHALSIALEEVAQVNHLDGHL